MLESTDGGVTTYRFSFEQEFILPDGRDLRLELLPRLEFQAREAEPIERTRALDDQFLLALPAREPLQGSVEGVEPLIGYGPCSHASLPLWSVEAELDDGSTLRLEERFRYTHRWQVHDLLMWDNCTVQHLASFDYKWPQHRRLMHRINVGGSATF